MGNYAQGLVAMILGFLPIFMLIVLFVALIKLIGRIGRRR